MALMSAKDFLAKKDAPVIEAHNGYISASDLPSNNTPNAKANITKSKGLISAADFKKSMAVPDVVTPQPTFAEQSQKFGITSFNPENLPMMQKANQYTIDNPTKPAWNGIMDNPISHGVETGLSWIQKPFEAISTIAADTVGQTKNLLGSKKRIGYDGKEFTSTPSQSRYLGKDLKGIFSNTNESISSDAWKGSLPNLNKLPGTNVNITDAIDFGAQALPLGEITAPLKGIKALKLAEDARAASKILPDYSTLSLSQGKGMNNLIKPIDSRLPDQTLNSSVKSNEPILLTPKQMAKRDQIEQFSKVEDNPTIPNTMDQIQSKTIAENTPFSQKLNNGYIKGVDNVHRLNQFDQKVAQVTGDLPASEQTHTLALNSRGSDMISRQILLKNMVDAQGNVTGGSFKSVVDQIPKGKQTEFEDYLVAQHSITRMGRGEKVYNDNLGMTVQKAQAKVAELEQANPEFRNAAESYYQYNQQLGKSWLVDTGLITPEQWDGYLAANPHYVPNQRIFSDLEKSQQFGSRGGFANQTAPIKKAEGSQRPIVRPIESTIENTAKYVKTAKNNEVFQTIYKNIEKDPEALKDWAETVDDGVNLSVSDILKNDGPDGLIDHISKGMDEARQKPDLTKGNIISGLIDGKIKHIRIFDPQMLEAVGNLHPQGQHFVMDAIGKVTKTMKVLTTGANPVFSLTRNIFRDIPTAFISSKSTNNIFKFGYDMVHSVLSVMGNGELYNSFKNMGGGHSSSIAADRNLLAQSMEKLLPSKGIKQTLKRPFTKTYHALENLNNALETAPRLAEYKRFSKDGSYDSKVSGLYQANDVTTNFNRFGNYTKQADVLFPYLNAAVQGFDKTVRVFKDNPTAAFSKAAGVVAVPTILMYALNHNNPDYQQLSNFVKDNNFLIPKGDGTFLKIPKTREFGAMFSTPIERVLRQWNDHDPRAFQDFVHNIIQNVAPPGIGGAIQGAEQGGLTGALVGVGQDTIAGPIASLSSNKDFANRPIVPQDLQKLSPKNQFDSKTSEPSKFLGNLFNTSPKQLDYLAKSYGGVLGQLGIPLSTQGGSITDTLKKQVTADPAFSNDISKNFFDAKNKADMAKADAKVTGDPLTKDLSAYYDRVSNSLSGLRKTEKLVQKDNSLSKDEKNKKLKELTQQMNDILKKSTLN